MPIKLPVNSLLAFVLLLLGSVCLAHVGVDSSVKGDAHQANLSFPLPLKSIMEIYEDKGKQESVDQVLAHYKQGKFKSLEGRALNTGLVQSAFWVLVKLEPSVTKALADIENSWVLELDTPYMNKVDVYLLYSEHQSIAREWHTGDTYTFSQRPLPTTNFTFPLSLDGVHSYTILIRLENDGLIVANPRLWKSSEYIEIMDVRGKLSGLFYGAMIIMAFYNFFIFLSIREKTYLYHVLCIIALTLFEACHRGDAFRYLWPNSPTYPNRLLVETLFFAEVFSLLFFYSFLKLDRYLKVWGQVIKAFAVVCAFMSVVALFMPNWIAVNIGSALAMIISALAIYVALLRIKMGSQSAKFFFIAWSLLLVAVFVTALTRFITVPVNVLTNNLISAGLIVEVALLSFALADKYKRMQVNAQNTLQEALKKLERSNLIKDQFLSTISHELRTPMNGIEGALELVNQRDLTDVDKLYLNTAMSSAKNMTAMVDALLRFNEMQAGSIVLKGEPFNPVTLFSQLSLDIEDRCKPKKISYEADTPSSALLVKGDAEQVKLVVLQLADNAVKYTPEGGAIQLKVYQTVSGGWASIVVRIQDTGVGMTDDLKSKIYQPFSSLDQNARGQGGLGIGLSLCRYLIEKMGGTLSIQSEEGQGTLAEVVLHLPILAHQAEQAINEPEVLPASQKVLIAEDNPVNQQVLKGILSKLGCNTIVVGNGQEAVETLKSDTFDMVFMDCQMPVMDGYEATGIIRKELGLREVPIIAVTANAMSTDKEKCMAAGMDDYLAKPIQIDQIRKTLIRWT